jgi:hypothetical protein
MSRIRRPSHATVVAYVALFVALTGGTTAVALSGQNTVQSDDLGPGAQVAAADIRANAVGSNHISDESIRGNRDIAANSVPSTVFTTNVGIVNDVRLGGPVNTDRFQVVSDNLTIYTACFTPAFGGTKYVEFTNRSRGNATLNWFFGNGSTVAANGVSLGPPDSGTESRAFNFPGGRIEGQFVFSTPNEMITVNLHAFDAGDRCEVHGTAQIKRG